MGYDAVIVGAGLGGLASGVALAARGKKVLILERMDFIGGKCSSEKIDSWTMDIGCHFLFGCEHGSFGDAARRIGKEIEFFHPTNYRMKVGDSMAVFDWENLVVTNPGSDTITVNIGGIFGSVPDPIMKILGLMMTPLLPRMCRIASPVLGRLDEITIKTILDRYVRWPVLRNFMETFQLFGFASPSWLTSWGELVRSALSLFGYYKPGKMKPHELMGWPMGGLQVIPDTFAEGILERGGEIRTGTGVKRVLVEGGRATGVELENGEVIKSNTVISNGGIKETVRDLVGEDRFDKAYAERIDKLIPGVSGFTLRACLDSKITDLELGFNTPVPDAEEFYHELWDGHRISSHAPPTMLSSPSNMDPSMCPPGKQIIMAIGASMLDTEDDHSVLEQAAIDSVDGLIPGFKDHIERTDLLTPKTYAVFGEYDAPAVGIAQSVGQVGKKRPSSVSPIKGLFYVGAEAGTNITGIACDMATSSGLACGDYILKKM